MLNIPLFLIRQHQIPIRCRESLVIENHVEGKEVFIK